MSRHHGIASFVTLSYDEEHVPRNDLGWRTLDKRDLQNFFKRLRKLRSESERTLKYYAIGEYGPNNTKRPHYHYIDFGTPLEDAYYDATECWRAGNIKVSQVDMAQIGYVANFHVIVKNGYNPQTEQQSEFAVNSQKLGYPSKAVMDKTLQDGYYQKNGLKYSIPHRWKDLMTDEQRLALSERNKAYYTEIQADREAMTYEDRRLFVERLKAATKNFQMKTKKRKF